MALIVEDGTIVANANSYVTVQEIRDYAALRGFDLPANDADVEPLAVLATDYLQSRKYQGYMVDAATQVLEWPRNDVVINCVEIANNVIPQQLKNAQCELAISAQDADLLSDGTQQDVKSESVGSLSAEYLGSAGQSAFKSSRANVYLAKLVAKSTLVRV